MFFPSIKEPTVKRIATTLIAAVVLSLGLTAVASAKSAPQRSQAAAKQSSYRLHAKVQRFTGYRLHRHAAV
jgi:Tfp pilus assembly protein PilV